MRKVPCTQTDYYLEVSVQEPLEEAGVRPALDRPQCPAGRPVLPPDLALDRRHGGVLHAAARAHQDPAPHTRPVPEVDKVPDTHHAPARLRAHLPGDR